MMHLKGSCQSVEEDNERLDRENVALNAELARLRRELEKARAELARMRPVVEAVMEYVASGMRERWPVLRAVEAYRDSAGKGDE